MIKKHTLLVPAMSLATFWYMALLLYQKRQAYPTHTRTHMLTNRSYFTMTVWVGTRTGPDGARPKVAC